MASHVANGVAGSGGQPAAAASFSGSGAGNDTLPKIHDALQLIYSPSSTNQARQEAQAFLEGVKTLAEAPSLGFDLASQSSHTPIVRHYGLSLLEDAIKHKWATYTPDQSVFLRNWVLQLSEKLTKEDPLFLRNKVALLWTEVAKRSWAGEWMDMDGMLLQLWRAPGPTVHKELVLSILETLSEEVFHGDDAVVAIREGVLSKACVDIFTPAAVLTEAFPKREIGPEVRGGPEGWMSRVSDTLSDCLSGDVQNDEATRACAVKSLEVFATLVSWAIPKALVATNCVSRMCDGLAAPNTAVQKASLEALHGLYSRSHLTDADFFVDLVLPMYDAKLVDLYRRLFEWSTVDPEDIDDDKYQFAKKFSELMACLGNHLDRRFSSLPPGADVKVFVDFLAQVVQSQSLIVSIPVLVTWTRLLGNRAIGSSIANTPLIGPLLQVCSSRLIRYENLPEDTNDPSYVLLAEDTDTIPERHAFLGNYRRYSQLVIEQIVQLKLVDAFGHIMGQADSVLDHLYDGRPNGFDAASYDKYSEQILRVDACFTVIDAALKGYSKWRVSKSDAQPDQKAALERDFEAWCNRLMDRQLQDPSIRKRVLQLLVSFSTTALDRNAGFMLKVLEYILMTWPSPRPENHKMLNDAIKDLQAESMVELQRLAFKVPDHLLDVYDQLQAKVNEMISSGTLDEKRQVAYQTFLFIIIHRATRLEPPERLRRLQEFVEPVKAQWRVEDLKKALSSFPGFCELVVLDKAQDYLVRKRISDMSNWGSVELDADGLALQAELEDRQTMLPLRSTKQFLTYSVEKLEKSSPAYQASQALWQEGFQVILPELLQFLTHAHACHNPDNWTRLPQEMRGIVGRVLTDRFWQAGISEGSKDDFYARVMDKKGTVEGLASTIRGSVRFVRETCYSIIYCMSKMDMQFYGFSELPGPLAHALFADSFCLSAHQVINLLNLVRYLVDNCPVHLRDHFLPPLLAACFQQMDAKITSEWDKLGHQQGVQSAGEALTEEMKAESILRQLTYVAVVMVADFLDPVRTNPPAESEAQDGNAQTFPSLRRFCLMQSAIVEPLLLFLSHTIAMRDGRCCGVALRVFRSIIGDFRLTQTATAPSSQQPSHRVHGNGHQEQDEEPPAAAMFPIPETTARAVREFISSTVMQACITSLHEPYFVEQQKELGSLIASILMHYSPLTETPRQVLLSLPSIKPEDVDRTIDWVSRPGIHSRQQRSFVLDLLKDLKGISISEMGKISKTAGLRSEASRTSGKRSTRSKMAQEFMTAPVVGSSAAALVGQPTDGPGPANRQSPDLDGVAGLFAQ